MAISGANSNFFAQTANYLPKVNASGESKQSFKGAAGSKQGTASDSLLANLNLLDSSTGAVNSIGGGNQMFTGAVAPVSSVGAASKKGAASESLLNQNLFSASTVGVNTNIQKGDSVYISPQVGKEAGQGRTLGIA